ncbi:TerC family protein [Pseudochelatococcus contaminans]|uniref:CBS domain containing-hemolysin-like protein n=1 Tax=Pseudochelatococcus contaminans TaxID=1538103 RepID=A0A7W5Z2U2_9HYPH|nr:TerC family protein [Pseudochelatococcus contaminans]MBB3808964.1 CBS domain containing-hemolysin-like protein [Pseudochelatococcus contaminans]
MSMEWIADPSAWAGLATLIVLEVVLGIDNLIFIAILADKLPPEQRNKARIIGLSLALIMRLALLASISWIVTLTQPIITILGAEISWRDVILIGGGAFLLFKGTSELHERLEGHTAAKASSGAYAVFWHVIAQIVVLDAVFSLDSVITAVGMVKDLSVMMIAVIVAVVVMMIASRPLMNFVSRHPTVVILCLGFLLMIGFSLIVEGLGYHIPKGYLYAAIGFSILVEAANQLGRRNVQKRVTSTDLRDRTARAVLRILRGGKDTSEASEEVAAIISTGGGGTAFTAAESSMIERVLTLGERNVRSIMVPRVDTIWLDAADPPEVVLREINQSGRSRFPVCRGEVDNVIGVVHAKDLLEQQRLTGTIDLATAVRAPLYVNDTMPVLRLLENFREANVHLAIVVDEHGTFEGVVTATDVLVAIAGDLPELAGEEKAEAVRREDGAWMLDGRMAIDEVERVLQLEDMDEDGDFTTLAGFMLAHLGHLPEEGEAFIWNGWRFEVADMNGRRIGSVVAGASGAS